MALAIMVSRYGKVLMGVQLLELLQGRRHWIRHVEIIHV
jgi:hypothetical protein